MRIVVLIAAVFAVGLGQDNSNCKPGVQSLCAKKKDKPKPTACSFVQKCKTSTGNHRSDSNFKKSMVDRHNYYRSQPYTGRGGPVLGADMVAVEWDNELEMNAWIWADALCEKTNGTDTVNIGHDPCRETPSFNYVGQNVAWRAGGSWSAPINVDDKALKGWNAENATVPNASALTGSFVFNSATGHYTQLMWAKSYRIGCAYVTSKSPKYKVQGWVVCNYGVGGNMGGQKVFAKGPLGSQCIAGSGPGGANGLCKVDPNNVAQFRQSIGVQNAS